MTKDYSFRFTHNRKTGDIEESVDVICFISMYNIRQNLRTYERYLVVIEMCIEMLSFIYTKYMYNPVVQYLHDV